MVASVGTSLLQQISLMNNGVLDKIEETSEKVEEFFRNPLVTLITWRMVALRPTFGLKGGCDQVMNGTAQV
jgi:hypothetical protein